MLILWIAASVFTLLGLTQLYAWQWWLAYFAALAARGPHAIRVHGLAVATVGMAIIVLHNVWSGAATVLTLAGWLFMAEGALCVIAPGAGLASMSNSDAELRRKAVIATGVLSLIVAGVLWAVLLV